jgi:hypothetical protein
MATLLVGLLMAALAAGGQTASPAATAVVTGRVVDADTGQPISGASVSLGAVFTPPATGQPTRPASSAADLIASLRPRTTETDTNGVFSIPNVPAGRYRLPVRQTGYVMLREPPLVEVAGGRVSIPDIRLDRGGTIVGRVLDAQARPVIGVLVQAIQLTKASDGTVRTSGSGSGGETNDLGEFRIPGLAPGDHYVVAVPRPNVEIALRGATPSAGGTTFVATYYPGLVEAASASPIRVSRGVTTSGIDFTMAAVPAYRVSGVVVDTSGRPVADAQVQLAPQPRSTFGGINQARTEADGSFQIPHIPSGTYLLMAAIPVVARSGNSTARSTNFSGAQPVEVIVQGGDVTGVRVVARQP